MDVNEIQIGGSHYQKEYQHWDFAIDTDMPYLLGCATKYPTRWLDKNGVQDLLKSIHYLSKAEDKGIFMPKTNPVLGFFMTILGFEKIESKIERSLDLFCSQLRPEDAEVIIAICQNEFEKATRLMQEMIKEVEFGPSSNYVDPDKNYIRG
jgi:hypothetical protein